MRSLFLVFLVASHFDVGCDCSGRYAPYTVPTVDIATPDEGTVFSGVEAQAFTVTGHCSEIGREVVITGDATTTVTCNDTGWTAQLNFSAAIPGTVSITVNHSNVRDLAATPATRTFVKKAPIPTVPTVSISSPAEGASIAPGTAAAFVVSGTCSENGRDVVISGSASATVTCTNNAWTATLDFSAAAPGTVSITVNHSSVDTAATPAMRTFMKTAVIPTVTITSPAVDSLIGSALTPSFAIAGTCSENGREVVLSGVPSGTVTCASGAWSTTLNLTTVLDGVVTVTANHADVFGTMAAPATRTFNKDTVAPVVTITSPTTGAPVSATNVTAFVVTGNCTENGRNVSITGALTAQTAFCMNGQWTISLDLTGVADGPLTITANQVDAALNDSVHVSVTVAKDATPPAVAITAPSANSFVNSTNAATFTISGTCSDNGQPVILSGAASTSVNCASGAWTAQVDFTASGQGNVTISANHSDPSGNPAPTATRTFVKDTVPPALTFSSPAVSTWSHGNAAGPAARYFLTFHVTGTCETGTGVNLRVAGSPTLVMTSVPCPAGTWAADLDLSPLIDGPFTVQVNATDTAGNAAIEASRDFLRDTLPPTVAVTAPNGGESWATGVAHAITYSVPELGSTVTIETSTTGLTGFTLLAGSPSSAGPFMWTPVTADLSAQARVRVSATDAAGNTGTDVSDADFSVTGPPPNLAWSPLVHDFGNNAFAYGKSGSFTFTLTNSGIGAATGCQAPILTGTDAAQFETTTDTCGTTDLAAGASCSINVRTNLTSLGLKRASLSRSCAFGGTVVTTADQIVATGIATSTNIYAIDSTNGDLGQAANNRYTSNHAVRFTNTGTAIATGCSAPSLVSPDFGIVSTDCTATLPIGGYCTVMIRGRPTATGIVHATLNFTCANASTVGLYLSLEGVGNSLPTHLAVTAQGLAATMSDGKARLSGMWGGTNTLYDLPGITLASNVSGSNGSFCVLLSNGRIQCEGTGGSGELGNGSTADSINVPVNVSGITTATQISKANMGDHACARLANSTIRCWGSNTMGQLGNGNTNSSSTPVTVAGINNAVEVAAGAERTCALLADTTVKCWGSNWFGALGDGSGANQLVPRQVKINATTNLTNVAHVSSGYFGSCAVLNDGTVQCWGRGESGEIGDGTFNNRDYATQVSGITTAQQVTAGYVSHCARLADGTINCWGENRLAALGTGNMTSSAVPVPVAGLSGVVEYAYNGGAGCALLGSGSIKCWGTASGYRADTTDQDTKVATTIPGLSGISDVVALESGNCGLGTNGTVTCWGRAQGYGELAMPDPNVPATIPSVVPGITTARQVAAGGHTGCILLTDGTIHCFGDGQYGQRGDGALGNGPAVTTVLGITNATQISGGSDHFCARLSDGTAKCWGVNYMFGLGDGTQVNASTPVVVAGLTGVQAVYASQGNASCAVLTNGTVKCWGNNDRGQLGDGSTTDRPSPVTVRNLSGVRALALGSNHSCATLLDGTMRCWGYNSNGQLGDRTTTDSSTPVNVEWFSNVTEISLGLDWTCALLNDGTGRCWGYGFNHSNLGVGQGTVEGNPAFSSLAGVSTAQKLSVRTYHGCVVLTGGSVQCWGWEGTGLIDLTLSEASGYIP